MPAVQLSRDEFDTRLAPLYKNLLLCAEKQIGYSHAADVVQDAVLSAWNKRADFPRHQDGGAFAVWVQAHLAFEIQDFIRLQARSSETSLPASAIFELCDGPDAPHWEQDGWCQQRQELYQRLHNFTLTPRQRDCCLSWVAGETLASIGARQEPPIPKSSVHYIIKRVGKMMEQVDDADAFDTEIGELIENQPAALTYACQMQRDNRVRREANLFAMKRNLMREASRVAPRVKPTAKLAGNRKVRRAAMQQSAALQQRRAA